MFRHQLNLHGYHRIVQRDSIKGVINAGEWVPEDRIASLCAGGKTAITVTHHFLDYKPLVPGMIYFLEEAP